MAQIIRQSTENANGYNVFENGQFMGRVAVNAEGRWQAFVYYPTRHAVVAEHGTYAMRATALKILRVKA